MPLIPPIHPHWDWDYFWQSSDRLLLAPMEGVVDWILRDLYTRHFGGIDLCVTEFVRVTDRLLPESEFYKYCPELKNSAGKTSAGVPVLLQLLGGVPSTMAENAQRAVELGALGIDLNFGCPAKTVNRHDGGATLLKNPERLFQVISAVRKAVPRTHPVAAKVRLGFSDKSLCQEIALAAEAGGASWLTVHARTRDEGYRPPAHWEYLAQMRQAIKIELIGNGEIWSPEDYHRCRQISGCRHIMIGRGLISRPDLAQLIKTQSMISLRDLSSPLSKSKNWEEYGPQLYDFIQMSSSNKSPHFALCRAKQWIKFLGKSFPKAESLFNKIKLSQTLDEMMVVLESEFGPAIPPTEML